MTDHSLFTYKTTTSFVVSLIYVDDVILAGDDLSFIQRVKQFLHDRFTIKDLGPLKYFPGIEVGRSPRGFVINQRKYVLDILADSGLPAAHPSASAIEQNHQLSRTKSPPIADLSSFRRLVGHLLYLTVTRLISLTWSISSVGLCMPLLRRIRMHLIEFFDTSNILQAVFYSSQPIIPSL
ncbi:unnamed protein product [Linum trigynum]|uniref:Reverse transcriptase Ty1/copia-type domain-containing protein n=1 Tax=Linum trigynum TaxID=586398 RepID=A0AAV2E6C8_9ROSI